MNKHNSTPVIRHDNKLSYPAFPYFPMKNYPELGPTECDSNNMLYDEIRKLFYDLKLDIANFDTTYWNPLGEIISPNQKIIIKPNWVLHRNPLEDNIDSLITHSSIIKVIIDYVVKALDYRGEITVADAPLQMCDFKMLSKKNRIVDLLELYKNKYDQIKFTLLDMRKTVLKDSAGAFQLKSNQSQQAGDPHGYCLVDLGQQSLLTDLSDRYRRFRVTCYDHKLLLTHHNLEKHEYLVANSFLKADVVINLPKMKCHKKAGFTGALKNLVGINGHKEYLPHHINGAPNEGGDQYFKSSRLKILYNRWYDRYWSQNDNSSNVNGIMLELLSKSIRSTFRDTNLEGGWHGNQTIPRTTVDLNNIAYFYNDKTGQLEDHPVRKSFHLLDGIVAGEGDGPLRPTAKKIGVLIAGFNPATVDKAMATMIGYDTSRNNTLLCALEHDKSLLKAENNNTVQLNSALTEYNQLDNLKFVKPKFWEAIEI